MNFRYPSICLIIVACWLAEGALAAKNGAAAPKGGASASNIIKSAGADKKDDKKTPGGSGPGVKQGEEGGGANVGIPAKTEEIEDFVAFVYSPGPRDPFISHLASGTIVMEKDTSEDISIESLMAFAEKLRNDLGNRVRVIGVSIPPDGQNSHALVIYADGRAEEGSGEGKQGGTGKVIVPALPPRTITVQSGIPVRYPPEETAFISRLAQLVAQNSPIRLKRDSRTEAVIFPVEKIDEKGVQVSIPGYEEPILLPVYRDIETFTGVGD